MGKKRRKKSKKPVDPQKVEQNNHFKEVRSLMANIGFSRVTGVTRKNFKFNGRTTELDEIFYCKNVVVFAECTIAKTPGDHLKNKKIIYDLINADPKEFFKFLIDHPGFETLKAAYEKDIKPEYSLNHLQIRIVYVSKNTIAQEHKDNVSKVIFFDYPIVKYFESISKIIKRTTIYEFIEFLNIKYDRYGENIRGSSTGSNDSFSGHILPEEQSSFDEGYKLVSFYIDAHSLLKRAFVLRRDGWKNKDNIGLYQRMFVGKKITSMRKYLHKEQRVFINNLIVTLSTDSITLLDEDGNELKVDSKGNFRSGGDTKVQPATIKIDDKAAIVGIIDGQHRLYSYHEGNDTYESSIAKLRQIQNLLVTGILFPKNEPEEKRIKFEANLFLEINSNQSSASAQLKQEIEFMRDPFSVTSIAKFIVNKLNESGPLSDLFEEYWFQKGKLKTASVISFGLRQLVKFDGADTLFLIWGNPKKDDLKNGVEDYELLNEYREFCVKEVRKIFIALKASIPKEQWKVDRKDANAVLTVTTINGAINCLRLIIENGAKTDESYYRTRLSKIDGFPFKKYKSSQYRKMGEDMYRKFF